METNEIGQLTLAVGELLSSFWVEALSVLPRVLLAGLIVIIGIVLAHAAEQGARALVRILKLEDLVEQFSVDEWFEKIGVTFNLTSAIAWIVKWSVILLAAVMFVDVLKWDRAASFLETVVDYIPNIVLALIITIVGIAAANFVDRSKTMVSTVVKWLIIVFVIMAALNQLEIAQPLINIVFVGIVAMLSLAGGLAFGLGGREHARRALDAAEHALKNDTAKVEGVDTKADSKDDSAAGQEWTN